MSGRIATAVVTTRLRNVIGHAANVYDSLANTPDEKSFKDRYLVDRVIHAYQVTRESSVPQDGELVQAMKRIEAVVIYGYRSFQAGVSEPLFQAEIDSICAAFDPPDDRAFLAETAGNPQLTGIDWSHAPKVEGPRMGMFGQALVHYVRITVEVEFFPIT